MTPRSLFIIIVRILGLFFIRDFLSIIPQLVNSIILLKDDLGDSVTIMVATCVTLTGYFLVSWFLIFKAAFIVDRLKLGKGFDEETIAINIHRSTILSISIIVLGGFILIDQIPNLCRQLLLYYQEKTAKFGRPNPTISYSVLAIAKIVIGFLMIAEQRRIVNFIEWKQKS